MNRHQLVSAGGVSFLCLLTGLLDLGVEPAFSVPVPTSSPSPQLRSQLDSPTLPSADLMEQVSSVSQLSDVQPTDWAFQALQSLVERYGCIVGYPDGTYRGNRALTQYGSVKKYS